ncbi:MAG: GNAT family N-acetyltransferase [Shimia sp.]|uniref:GNAT family N-acetyltransferase n=1 Tax=Shimia sp. TaxID=1954381 RepID=UPI004059D499
MSFAPTITTARLTLRHHVLDDFKPMATHFATDWARYMGGPVDANELWRWLGAEITSWQWLGFGSWAVDHTDTSEFIGQVGINKSPKLAEPELGYCFFPEAQGKGYALEAVIAARDWGFDIAKLPTMVSYIDDDNAASIRLAEKLGAVRDDAAARPDANDLVYRHLPEARR